MLSRRVLNRTLVYSINREEAPPGNYQKCLLEGKPTVQLNRTLGFPEECRFYFYGRGDFSECFHLGQEDVNGEKLTVKKRWIFGADFFTVWCRFFTVYADFSRFVRDINGEKKISLSMSFFTVSFSRFAPSRLEQAQLGLTPALRTEVHCLLSWGHQNRPQTWVSQGFLEVGGDERATTNVQHRFVQFFFLLSFLLFCSHWAKILYFEGEKVLGKKFRKSAKKCENSETILPFSCRPWVFPWIPEVGITFRESANLALAIVLYSRQFLRLWHAV